MIHNEPASVMTTRVSAKSSDTSVQPDSEFALTCRKNTTCTIICTAARAMMRKAVA